MKKFVAIGILLGVGMAAQNVQALSVDEAYKAIPHRQTEFQKGNSDLPAAERIYLAKLFRITDEAMAARVEHLSALYYFKGQGDGGRASYEDKIKVLIGELQRTNPPRALKKAHKLILESIQEQRRFFTEWSESSSSQKKILKASYSRHHLVQSSHHKLFAAYNDLMRLFPRENSRNKQAFFDHLCALDFL